MRAPARDLGPRRYMTQDRMVDLTDAAFSCLNRQKETLIKITDCVNELENLMAAMRDKGLTRDHPLAPEIETMLKLFNDCERTAQASISHDDMETIITERTHFRDHYRQNRFARNAMRKTRANQAGHNKDLQPGSRLDPDMYDLDRAEYSEPAQFNDEAALRAMREYDENQVKSMLSTNRESAKQERIELKEDDASDVDDILPDTGDLGVIKKPEKRSATSPIGFKRRTES